MITCEPIRCVYWENPNFVIGEMAEKFERFDTFACERHWWRYLLKCRECGQLYFYEFYELVDWKNGKDPQYTRYIPVADQRQLDLLKCARQTELLQFSPSLNIDFPEDADSQVVYWTRKGPAGISGG